MIRTMQNTQWKWCYRSLFLAAIFSVVCIYAFNYIDGFSGGYAIAFVSFFLAVSAIAVAALFFHRARVMDFILNSTHLLAHWTYSPDVAMQSAKREYADYQERNRAMFLVIGGMLVFFALVMMIFAGEGGFITGIFLLAVTVFLFIVSRVAPRIALRCALSSPREAYIAENGIIYEGAVYPFQSFLMRMNGASFQERTEKKPAVLIFSFIQSVGLSIRSPFDIEIPVPQGEEEKARKIEQIQNMFSPIDHD
jgi:hypothetical protein